MNTQMLISDNQKKPRDAHKSLANCWQEAN